MFVTRDAHMLLSHWGEVISFDTRQKSTVLMWLLMLKVTKVSFGEWRASYVQSWQRNHAVIDSFRFNQRFSMDTTVPDHSCQESDDSHDDDTHNRENQTPSHWGERRVPEWMFQPSQTLSPYFENEKEIDRQMYLNEHWYLMYTQQGSGVINICRTPVWWLLVNWVLQMDWKTPFNQQHVNPPHRWVSQHLIYNEILD